jgi:hypothetical protein
MVSLGSGSEFSGEEGGVVRVGFSALMGFVYVYVYVKDRSRVLMKKPFLTL